MPRENAWPSRQARAAKICLQFAFRTIGLSRRFSIVNALASLIPPPWRETLHAELRHEPFAAKFAELARFVTQERQQATVFPPEQETFAALQACPPEAVRVLVLGQDPYHASGQAHGLAFSVAQGQRIPPSLRNIYKERAEDVGLAPAPHGDLSAWARQGVLLLNTVLTVREGEAHSHKGRGWEVFTDAVVERIAKREQPTIFLLWGKPAQKKAKLISAQHRVLQSAHPSPLSAHRGFLGSKPFSQINQQLDDWGYAPIDWRVEGE